MSRLRRALRALVIAMSTHALPPPSDESTCPYPEHRAEWERLRSRYRHEDYPTTPRARFFRYLHSTGHFSGDATPAYTVTWGPSMRCLGEAGETVIYYEPHFTSCPEDSHVTP